MKLNLLKGRLLLKTLGVYGLCPIYTFTRVRNIQIQYLSKSARGNQITELNEDTLIGRLLVYLDANRNPTVVDNNKFIEISNVVKGTSLQKISDLNINELIYTLTLFPYNDCVKNTYEISAFLKLLDIEFCKRLNNLSIRQKFSVLHLYMKILPNKILQYSYYKMAIEDIFKKVEVLNKADLIKLIFYIGLTKKNVRSRYMLSKCMKIVNKMFIDDLTTEDICIICNSTYKTSTKITDKVFLNKICNHFYDNLSICGDSALLVTMIKTIRSNHYQNEELLTTLSYTCFFNKTIRYYSFIALCHILALYSDCYYYDDNLTRAFTDKCIELLKDSKYISKYNCCNVHPRGKDIRRFLWCLSILNYKNLGTSNIRNIIIPSIMRMLKAEEFEDTFALTDIILCLWILNYRAYELIQNALTKKTIQLIKASKSPAKHSLNLLLSCIYFEDKALYRQINIHVPENPKYDTKLEVKKRCLLSRILKNLKLLTSCDDVNKFEIGYQIPYLRIAGITGYRKGIYPSIYIEVLDDCTSLKNTDHEPIGLMQLKLRILQEMKERLIVIQEKKLI